MSQYLNRTSETTVNVVVPSYSSAITAIVKNMTPSTYALNSVSIGLSIATSDGTYTENSDSNYTISAAGTYTLTFANDGVYYIEITVSAVTTKHIVIINDGINTKMSTVVNNAIVDEPDKECYGSDLCKNYQEFNVLSLILLSMFADEIDINFNYDTVTSGYLYNGYKYECINAGSSTRDFQEGAKALLMTNLYAIVAADTALTLDALYTCINTGLPDSWGSTQVTALNNDLETRLNNIADSIERATEYINNIS